MFEASEMQVSILQSPFKFFCHGMQINMPAINKSIMILRASAASWHLFWSHNLWMPGRSIHSRCPMTLYFWMCLIGYGTSLDLKTNLSPGKHNILFWTFIPFWAIGLSTSPDPSPSQTFETFTTAHPPLPTVPRVLFNGLGVFYFFFSGVPRVSFIARVSFIIFWVPAMSVVYYKSVVY